jgi:hypothetical protein
MHYKYKHHLFSRGAKHFNPYAKRVLHNKRTHHSGGSIATDYELLKLLGNLHPFHHKKSHHHGGALTHSKPKRRATHKALHFTR